MRLEITSKDGYTTLAGLDVLVDGHRVPGLCRLEIVSELDDVVRCRLDFVVKELEIDVSALADLKARLELRQPLIQDGTPA